jgi:hypothetical protein
MEEDQVHSAHGTVALFGNDQLRQAPQVLAVAVVNFLAEDEAHDVGVLLDEARFA